MTGYTVFEHTEVDEPLGCGLSLEEAFLKVCYLAGFKPVFRRDGGVLLLEFEDETGRDRQHEPFRAAHPIFVRARRMLMQEAIDKGVWGVCAATDERWRQEVGRIPVDESQGVPFLRNGIDEQHYAAASRARPHIPTLCVGEDGQVQLSDHL